MTTDARAYLRAMLIQDEGLRLKPYRDTVGKLSIGVGRNLDDVGISQAEAFYLLENDIDAAIKGLVKTLPWFVALDPVRQVALINLAFNMGIGNQTRGLLSFRNTLAAIAGGRYADAAAGLRKSKWYRQVGRSRSERLIHMMSTGEFPKEEVRV